MNINLKDEYERNVSDTLAFYAEKNCSHDLIAILLSHESSRHYSVVVNAMSLFEFSIDLAHLLFQSPSLALKLLDSSLQKVASNIYEAHELKSEMILKDNLHVRLTSLPSCPEVFRTVLPKCCDVGQFLCITGTVIRATSSKMLEYRKLWRCTKCKYQFSIDADVEQGYVCEKPTFCTNPDWCCGKNFTLMSIDINPLWCKDYQEVKIQEQIHNLSVGTVPRSMWVILENDLVESCQPGNDVNISGILIQRWKPLAKGCFTDIDLMMMAHNVEVKNKMAPESISKDTLQEFRDFWMKHQDKPLAGRDFILSSICPQVFGLHVVKLAVALVMAGGVQKTDGNSRIRGDSHLLLIGDPGTGKSQFLKYASKISVRSVLTSGIGTTNAGLTASAVKEGGKWHLEAGALVLADGGICCIDEFSCIKEQDKTCIHEAMEQQTISVAKAGLVCSLSTACTILAATNPKGNYDKDASLSENTALASPLLSRFDIILVLLDNRDEEWDKMVSTYITKGKKGIFDVNSDHFWSIMKMKQYFSIIRYIKPKVTQDCERVLQAYYKKQRSFEKRNAARTTPRLLQSLIRLAEGHARLMFREKVLVIDAIIAITLIESSMAGFSIVEGLNPLHTTFPENAKEDYENIAETVLRNLDLTHMFISKAKDYEVSVDHMALWNELSSIEDSCMDCTIEDSKCSFENESASKNPQDVSGSGDSCNDIHTQQELTRFSRGKGNKLEHKTSDTSNDNTLSSRQDKNQIEQLNKKNCQNNDHISNSANSSELLDDPSTISELNDLFSDDPFDCDNFLSTPSDSSAKSKQETSVSISKGLNKLDSSFKTNTALETFKICVLPKDICPEPTVSASIGKELDNDNLCFPVFFPPKPSHSTTKITKNSKSLIKTKEVPETVQNSQVPSSMLQSTAKKRTLANSEGSTFGLLSQPRLKKIFYSSCEKVDDDFDFDLDM